MPSPRSILQLRIDLAGADPSIWRRIQVPADYSFWDLHVAIQSAFGWNDTHLHEFQVPGGRWPERLFGIPDGDFAIADRPTQPGWEHRIADFLTPQSPRIRYLYDFGDIWLHEVILEKCGQAEPGKRYPRCVAGARAAPPDDSGGVHGYAHLLSVLANPADEDHEAMQEWIRGVRGKRGRFDPNAFDEQTVRFASPGPRLKRVLAWLADAGSGR